MARSEQRKRRSLFGREQQQQVFTAPADDLPRVVITRLNDRASDSRGWMSLGEGSSGADTGARSHFGMDVIDLILPVVLIAVALFAADRTFKLRLGRFLPDFDIPAAAERQTGSARARTAAATYGGTPSREAPGQVSIVLDIEVTPDGTPGEIQVVRGVGGTADQRAIERARDMRFEPARRAGQPVTSHIETSIQVPLR